MTDDNLPEHLEELAWLLGQYDNDDDMDVLWPDIEARATSALQAKIAEKRKQDTYRFLVNPVRTLVKESWTESFRKSVNTFRAVRTKEEEKLQAKAKMDAIRPTLRLKRFLKQKFGTSVKPEEGTSPAAKKNQMAGNCSPDRSPNKQGKQLKKPPIHVLLNGSRKCVEKVGKSSSRKRVQNQVVNGPHGKTLQKKQPPSFNKDSEEEDSSSAEDEFSDEDLVPTKKRGGTVKNSSHQRSQSKSPRAMFIRNVHQTHETNSLSDEEYHNSEVEEDNDTEEELSEEDDGEEDETRAESYNMLNLPSAPRNLPYIYCELSLMLAEVPSDINWDILAKRASPELRDMILEKKSRDERAFRNSPYNQLVPLQVYDSFQWYRMALRKAMAQPLAPLTAQVKGGLSSRNLTAGNYSIVFDKQSFMTDPSKAPHAAVSIRRPASAVHPAATKVAQHNIPLQKLASSITVQRAAAEKAAAATPGKNIIFSSSRRVKKVPTNRAPVHISTAPLHKAAPPGKKALPAVPVEKVALLSIQPAPKAISVAPVQKAAPLSAQQPGKKAAPTAPGQKTSPTNQSASEILPIIPVRKASPTSQVKTKALTAASVQKAPTSSELPKEQPALPPKTPQPSLKQTVFIPSVNLSVSLTKDGKESSSKSPSPTKAGKAPALSLSKEAIKKSPLLPKGVEMQATCIEKSPASPKTKRNSAASVEMLFLLPSTAKSFAFNNQSRHLHRANAPESVGKPSPTTDAAMESPPGSFSPSRPPTCTIVASEDEKGKDIKNCMKTFVQRKADGSVLRDDDDDKDDCDEVVGEDDDEYRAREGGDESDEDEYIMPDVPRSLRNKERKTKNTKSTFSGTNDRLEKADHSSNGKKGYEVDDEDYELDNMNPLAVLTPELHELAELLGKQKHPFDWQLIERSGSRQLKVFFAAKRKKFEHFDRNRGGYLIRTQQRANFRRLRRKVIRRLKGTPCVDRSLALEQYQQQKRISVMKTISVLTDVDESSLTDEQRELARALALQESENDIDWNLVKLIASPALNRLIESEEQHVDFKNDPLRFLVGGAKYSTFKKVRSCLSAAGGPQVVNVGDSGDIALAVMPKVPGLEQWSPVQREFALILAELSVSGNVGLALNKAHDWQYIFKAASPTLRSVLDAKSKVYPSFFRTPDRFMVSHNDDEDVARFLELRKSFETALANNKDRLIAKAKALAPKIKRGPRMSEEEIDKALEGLESLPRLFVEFAEILEDIKEQHTGQDYDTIYDWDYINGVASKPLRRHIAEKRALKCFESSKMNTLIGKYRHLPFKNLRVKIRRFRDQKARRSSQGQRLTRPEYTRFEKEDESEFPVNENEDESESSVKAAFAEAESSLDLEPFLPEVTKLIEPEIQLARILEEIKFLRPSDNGQTIWDMNYIFSHAPSRLKRHLEGKMRLCDRWAVHKLRVFVRLDRALEFKKMRQLIKGLLEKGQIKPLPCQKEREDSTLLEKLDASIEGTSDRKKSAETARQPQNHQDEDGQFSSADNDCGNDSDQSYTDVEEMVTLKNSSRGIKLTSSLKELAIYWELFNDRGQDSQPNWDKVEKHVSPSLRRLIREKRQLRIFKNDPSLLLVFPDLRANFDRVRAEVRRDPEFHMSSLPKALVVKQNLDDKKRRKRSVQTKDAVAPEKACRVVVDDDHDDSALVLQTNSKKARKRKRIADNDDETTIISEISNKKGRKRSLVERKQPPSKVRKIIVDDDHSGDDDHSNAVAALKDDKDEKYQLFKETMVMFITRIQMKELARLMAHATQRKEGWAFVEARASGPLRVLMDSAATKHPADYMDGPTRCLVAQHLWSEFTGMREKAAKTIYKDDDVDIDNDFGEKKPKKRIISSASAFDIVENQRELLEAFSKKMREQLIEFEINQQELISRLKDED